MSQKRKLYQSKHPLGSYPFEAFLSGSWKAVELIKIEGGTPTLHFIDNQKRVLQKNPGPDIRIRSRKATLSDCSCFLRPGIDVCVSSASQQDNRSGKFGLEPGRVDAKIRSIQRKPHISECSCEYFVNLYVNQGRYDPEKSVLSKETKVVGINQISILQKFDHNPCENQHYRWDLSEDCFKAQKTKLFTGKFLSDFSWLLVASTLKRVSFCVRSAENKIVYQILGCEHSSSSLNYSSLKHVNFSLDNGMVVPIVSDVIPSDNNKADQVKDTSEDEITPISCIEGLRRSKRRNIEPERYLGCDDVSKLNFGHVRTNLPKSNPRYEDEKADVDMLANCLGKDIDACQNIKKINTCQEVLLNNSRAESGMVKLDNVDEKGHQAQLVRDPLPDGVGPAALDLSFLNTNRTGNSRHESYIFSEYNYLTHSPDLNRKIVNPWTFEPYDHQLEVPDHHQSVVRDSLPDEGGPVALDHSFLNTNSTGNSCHESCVFSEYNHLTRCPELNRNIVDPWTYESYDHQSEGRDPENSAIEIDDKSSVRHFGTCGVSREEFSALEDMETEIRKGVHSNEEIQEKEYLSPMTRSKSHGEERTYKGRSLSDAENPAKEIGDKSSGCYDIGTCNVQTKDLPGLEDMDPEEGEEGAHSDKEIQGGKYEPPMTRSKTREKERTYKNRSSSVAENSAKDSDDKSSECYDIGSCNVQKKDLPGLEDMDSEKGQEGAHSDKEIEGGKYQPPMTRSKTREKERTHKNRSLSDAEDSAKEAGDKSSGCYDIGTCNVQKKDLPGMDGMDSEKRQEGVHSDKDSAKEAGDKSSGCYDIATCNVQKKDLPGMDGMDSEKREEGVHSDKEIQGGKYQPPMTRSKTCEKERTYKNRSLSDAENSAKEIGDKSSGCYNIGTCNVQRNDLPGLEDMDTENRLEGMHSEKEIQGKSYNSPVPRSKTRGKERTYKDRSLSDAGNSAKEIGDKSSGCYYFGTCNVQRKDLFGLEDMDTEHRWEGICSHKEIQGKKYHSLMTRSKSHGERTYKNRSSSDNSYKELIDLYLKNVDTTPAKEERSITDQWVEFKAMSDYGQNEGAEADGEVSEIDMLWREMEVALASVYVFDDTESSKAAISLETEENSNKLCQHEFILNEEIGIYCCRCGFVKTEIRDISPPFVQNLRWQHDEKQWNDGNSKAKPDENDSLHFLSDPTSTDIPACGENDIWNLIPKLTSKLHVHQKKAFEFLWENISGSVKPASMKAASKRIGGCVISHTPGAGKTFLIIAFLASYLKLFPGKRPLVLAPKTTLYTWYKEFIKWEIPIPVYLIQSQRRLGACKEKPMVIPGVPQPTGDVWHLLDSLEKIQKWHSHPSVLVMSYSYFLRLMGDNSRFSYRQDMAEILRKSPGVLILDEGHNPRSTGSCLRKALMKVETELRILLSGTLFQNNFCEYFNTLCLARPRFIHEVLRELDPKYRGDEGRAKRKANFMESRARKFFLDKIAKKIDSDDNDGERLQGLNMLRKITNGFIDVYDGGSSDNLPGLHVYTLLVNITDFQEQIFRALYEKVSDSNRYPLEVELLVTLGAIHPWLIKTAAFSDKFLTEAQLSELENCKFDLKIGPKVRFVLSLIFRVVKEEKTLVFFHYIAPMKLFVELFEKFFGWQTGREVLVLSGEQDLFERGRVIDKFEEPGGASKVLLASITACSEGISLTAASRVILLESEWNPSRTRQAIARAFRPGQQRIVYVYQLLVTGTMEEEKYAKITRKERVSRMIFSEDFVEDQFQRQAEKLEDDILQEMIAEDKSKIFHMIMKDEKASTN